LVIKKYLQEEPEGSIEELFELYAKALWMEEREVDNLTAAIQRAFPNK
jgi:hypothetical protein